MKTIIASLFAVIATGQQVVKLPDLTVSAEAVSAIQQWMLTQTTSTQTTLTADKASSANTITVANAASLKNSDALLIGAEALPVVSVSGNVVTVNTGKLGTAAADHKAGDTVSVLKFPTINALFRQIIADAVGQIMEVANSSTIAAQKSAIQAAQAQIEAVRKAAVQ